MPFGIKTASEEYQRRQTEALQGVPGLAIVADDLLVCGYVDTMQEASQNQQDISVCYIGLGAFWHSIPCSISTGFSYKLAQDAFWNQNSK